jgi:hypothetical protein
MDHDNTATTPQKRNQAEESKATSSSSNGTGAIAEENGGSLISRNEEEDITKGGEDEDANKIDQNRNSTCTAYDEEQEQSPFSFHRYIMCCGLTVHDSVEDMLQGFALVCADETHNRLEF